MQNVVCPTRTVAGQQLQQSPRQPHYLDEKLLVILFLLLFPSLVLSFSLGLGVAGGGGPKKLSTAATAAVAALRQTSQRVKPSTNTSLFAEQQWSFVACLIVDSKL